MSLAQQDALGFVAGILHFYFIPHHTKRVHLTLDFKKKKINLLLNLTLSNSVFILENVPQYH